MFHFGTKRGDLFEISETELSGAYVYGRRGYDILAISASDDYAFDRTSYGALRGIEEIDFSAVEGNLSITLDVSILNQARRHELVMTFNQSDAVQLAAPAFSGGELFLKGSGSIQLSSDIDNLIQMIEGATLEVHGGSRNDTIIAANGGMLLDGQQGDDQLVAGSGPGADTIRFAPGFDVDTVTSFNPDEDLIALEGFELTQLDEIFSQTTMVEGNTIIDFGGGDQLILVDVNANTLSGSNFTLNGEPLSAGPPVINIAVGTSAAEFNQMIADAEDGTIFALASGNHIFDASIVVARDNISIEGASPDEVTITFAFADGDGADGLVIRGDGDTYISTLPDGAQAGSDILVLRESHGFEIGDAIYIQQPNSQSYLDANGWTNVSMTEAASRPFRESIHTIEAMDGNTVTLSTPIPYALEAGEGRYYAMDLTHSVELSGFSITYNLGETDRYDFNNTHAEFDATSALLLANTSGVTISNIHLIDSASTALNLTSTIDARIDDIFISGSHNKGGGGNGYGVELHEAFDNQLTNFEIFDMRHSVVLSAWHAEVNNLIEITTTNRDINLHGSPDYANVIKVGSSILDYDVDETMAGGDSWAILSAGGTNHALTDMSANYITFDTAIASNRNDTLIGGDEGSLLVGGFGYDRLIGGAGEDIIIGGTRRDTMTGGDGSDTFVLFMGDDLDRITDFDFTDGGDSLIFSSNPDMINADDLRIYQTDNDTYIRYGSNSTVIIEDTSVDQIDTSHFQFDPLGLISSQDFILG